MTARSGGVHRATHILVPTHATGGRGRGREEGGGGKRQARTKKVTGGAKEGASVGEAGHAKQRVRRRDSRGAAGARAKPDVREIEVDAGMRAAYLSS